MNILVAGVSGFLGRVLANNIVHSKHQLIGLNRDGKNSFVACDIGHPNELLEALNRHKPEAIINCTAKVDFLEGSKQEQFNVNALAPAIMASWCATNNAHLI